MARAGYSEGPMPASVRARGLPFNQELALVTSPSTCASPRALTKGVAREVRAAQLGSAQAEPQNAERAVQR